jgi:aminoglycoside 3-N-acetyltransferase
MFTTTKNNLIAHLVDELGIKSDDIVFMHSGIVGLGKLENGMDTITEVFEEVLPEGLLVIPSFTYSWCKGEAYDPATTECPNEVGSYSQNVWKDKRFVRSRDPNFAVAALKNKRNQRFIETIFGIGNSCFGKNAKSCPKIVLE